MPCCRGTSNWQKQKPRDQKTQRGSRLTLTAETTARLGKHGIGVDRTILTLAGSLRHVMASMPAVTLQDAAAHWARLGVGLNALGLGYVAEFKAKFFFG